MNYIEVTFKIKPLIPTNDLLIYYLSEIDYESFVNTKKGVKAYIKENLFDEGSFNKVLEKFDSDIQLDFTFKTIKEQNWNANWEKDYPAIEVGDKCIIRAPFHELDKEYQYEIIIQPQMSFGTGHHATTYLMSKMLLKENIENMDVLDMGCGTGVLAILSEKLMANKIDAIDIDKWAYENTIENIELNKCQKISASLGDKKEITNNYDIILANINRNILVEDMEVYASHLKNGGKLFLSGFFVSDQEIIKNETEKNNLKYVNSIQKDEWTAMVFEK